MKIALIGYGAMGRLVDARARQEGHEVVLKLVAADAQAGVDAMAERLRGADAAIDFSVAGGVLEHVQACARAGVPLVEGTTGWNAQLAPARAAVAERQGALVYGANFSVGVYVFYRIADRAAELFGRFDAYAAFLEEAHHARKKDAPSGTALRLVDILSGRLGRQVPVASTRAGHIPGTHRVGFDSPADQVLLEHTARNRDGFAAGALLAAAWIQGHRGVYEFSQILDEISQANGSEKQGD